MRSKTGKYMSTLFGLLAIVCLLQWIRLERQLKDSREHARAIQEHCLKALRETRQAIGDPKALDAAAAAPGENRLSAEERRYYQRRMQRMEKRIAFLETAAATWRAPRTDQPHEEHPAFPHKQPSPTDALLTVLGNPELRDLLRLQMLTGLEQEYQSLLFFLDYDISDEDTLLALLMEKKWNAMQLQLIMLQDALDPELRRYAVDVILADQEDLRTVLAEFMGDDDFAVYEAYEQTQPERRRVGELQQTLASHGIPLDERQEHELILMLHEAGIFSRERAEPAEPGENGSRPLTREAWQEYADELTRQHEHVLNEAEHILAAEQMEFFKSLAASQIALQKAMLHQHIQDRETPRRPVP